MTDAPPPLARSGTVPVLHGVLGAAFHLEVLEPDDEARLTEANELIAAWFGDELRWTLNSRIGFEEPFRLSDFEYVNLYPTSLAVGPVGLPDPLALVELGAAAQRRRDMGLACHGGEKRMWSSPFSYEFYADIHGSDNQTPQLLAPAVLRITVPATWPLADFRSRVLELATVLNLRWAAAGLTYSAWLTHFHRDAMQAMHRHARRHPGYDIGLYVAWMEQFYLRLRTVGWLTVLGPPLQQELFVAARGLPESDPLVEVSRVGDHLVLQAGDRPRPGDINRLDIPPSYVRADEMVRPIRAGDDVDFYEEWTEHTTGEWLRRFEKRLF